MDLPADLPSRGSRNHCKGQCKPCRELRQTGFCAYGVLCNSCHYDHAEENQPIFIDPNPSETLPVEVSPLFSSEMARRLSSEAPAQSEVPPPGLVAPIPAPPPGYEMPVFCAGSASCGDDQCGSARCDQWVMGGRVRRRPIRVRCNVRVSY